MARNFSKTVSYDKQTLLAVFVPRMRKDGLYYEVNIAGMPRFHVSWSALERYEVCETDITIPYNLVLAVSDVLEEERKKR